MTDLNTGLVWKKASEPGTYTWYQAVAMAGLPSKDQLLSLVPASEAERTEMYATLSGVRNTDYLWSSTPYDGNDNCGWLVNLFNSNWGYASVKSAASPVRLLSSGQ